MSFFIFLVYITIMLTAYSFRKLDVSGDPQKFEWHFLIPCRDEETVIGQTVEYYTRTFHMATFG
ncbi:MAG: hypothetical protein LBP35_04565 [Candidatus Ancillula trichonymphae]|nr:hypothetical protein [Candidatus Ancillula trichonymphae]